MQALRPAEHRRERLDRRPDDVHLRLLGGERDAGGLRVEAHQPRARIAGAEPVAQLPRPDPPGSPVLRDLLEEVEMRVEEEREAGRKVVHVEATLDRPLDVGEAVSERERELLRCGRPGLADVVAGDRDRVPLRHLLGTPLDHVRHEPHRWLGREDVLLLRDVLLQDVRLDRPAQLGRRHALLLADSDVEREQDRGRRVDGHRRRHLSERNALEEGLHVRERIDRDALATDLAERALVVRVVAHQRRHIERGREPGLAVLEQITEALVRLRRGAEARELAHRPELPAVHRGIDTARERMDTRIAEVAVVVDVDRVRRRQRLVLDPRDRGEELSLPLRCAPVQLLAPRLRRVQRAPVLGRGHEQDCRDGVYALREPDDRGVDDQTVARDPRGRARRRSRGGGDRRQADAGAAPPRRQGDRAHRTGAGPDRRRAGRTVSAAAGGALRPRLPARRTGSRREGLPRARAPLGRERNAPEGATGARYPRRGVRPGRRGRVRPVRQGRARRRPQAARACTPGSALRPEPRPPAGGQP